MTFNGKSTQRNGQANHLLPANLAMAMDGELSGAEGMQVREHLQICSDCRSRLARMQEASEAVRGYHQVLDAQISLHSTFASGSEHLAARGVRDNGILLPNRPMPASQPANRFRVAENLESGYNKRTIPMSTPGTQPAPVPGPGNASSPTVPPSNVLPTLFGDGYGIYSVRRGSFVASYTLVTVMAVAIVLAGKYAVDHQEVIKKNISAMVTDISPYILPASKSKAGGGGGGGDHDKFEASKGSLPKFAKDQFTPPVRVIRNPNPVLPMTPTVVVPPQIKIASNMPVIGDPYSHNVNGPESNGTGTGGGIGSGSGGGIGSGTGPGVGPGYGGGIGGGVYSVGGGVSAPKIVYQPDPEYSDEARKAKYQGIVVLWCVVGADGRVRDVRVQRSLGMGLDEKAMEAVRTWKFEPARKDGVAVPVQVAVEVNFRLY